MSFTHGSTHTQMNSHRLWVRAQSQARWDPSTEEEVDRYIPALNKKLPLILLAKGKLVFSNGVSLGISTTLEGRPYTQD